MGLNSYFTFGVCQGLHIRPEVALAAVSVSSLLYVILSGCGICGRIQAICPTCVKKAITCAIGFFQAFIGFQVVKVVVGSPKTLVTLGNLEHPVTIISIAGVFLIALLLSFDIKGAMLIGIAAITGVCWATGWAPAPQGIFSLPSFANWQLLDLPGFWEHKLILFEVVLSFLFVCIFDVAGVMFGAGMQAGLVDEEGHLPGSYETFLGCAVSSLFGALGSSPAVVMNETCAGIQEGGRTGLTACVTATLFLFSLFLGPLLVAVPVQATAPPLVIIGIFMMAPCRFIDWDNFEQAFPAFLTISVMPLTFSIANGVVAGILSFSLLSGTRWFS
eukprot:Platyproteum_vivax@DN11946_c0_g1_i1.p1